MVERKRHWARAFSGAIAAGLTAFAIAGFAPRASAADMPVKAPPLAPPSWTGCYVGGQVGGVQSTANWAYNNLNPYNSLDPAGPLTVTEEHFRQVKLAVGAQAGCNYSFNGPWMVGVEAAYLGNAMNRWRTGSQQIIGTGQNLNTQIATEITAIGSVTGRVGYSLTPDWLLYAKGGYAGAHIRAAGLTSPSIDQFNWNDSRGHSGWTVGAGLEYRLFRNVTVGAEYSYYRFGDVNHIGNQPTVPAANQVDFNARAEVQSVMARVNIYDDASPRAKAAQAHAIFDGEFSASLNADARYASWGGSRGTNVFATDPGKGYQIYTPTTFGVNYEQAGEYKVETRLKGGYVYARHDTPNQGATYEGPVDTQLSVNMTILSNEKIRPTMGVAVNLPTGSSFLPGNQRFARMDPDLVEVGSYGVGYNVNPSAGFMVGVDENTAVSVSAGYAFQGVFYKEGVDLSTGNGFGTFDLKRRIHPGDALTASANVASTFGKLELFGSFAYMSERQVTIDGVATGRAGARYLTNLVLAYQIDPKTALSISGSWSFKEKNDIPNLFGGLIVEPKNSNSHVVIAAIEPTYQLTEQLKVGPTYALLWRSANFYDQLEESFSPAKTKHSAGLALYYAVSKLASIELRGSHAWIRQDTGPFVPLGIVVPTFTNAPPSISYHAWLATVSGSIRF